MIKNIIKYKPNIKNIWNGKYKIPWDEPEFSKRMLKMHLSQKHDLASRRDEIISNQVNWIQTEILKNKKSKILDIGCGPGIYIKKFLDLGHECTGIDFSPASIDHANKFCKDANFFLGDITKVDYKNNYDFGLFCVWRIKCIFTLRLQTHLKKSIQ